VARSDAVAESAPGLFSEHATHETVLNCGEPCAGDRDINARHLQDFPVEYAFAAPRDRQKPTCAMSSV